MSFNKKGLCASLFLFFFAILIVNFWPEQLSYLSMARLSIIQLICSILVVKFITNWNFISFPNLFFIFSWFFHCGQIVKIAYSIPGEVSLDFTKYASAKDIMLAYQFYFISQIILLCGIVMFSKEKKEFFFENNEKIFDARKSWITLIAVGVVPRLYIDIKTLIGGMDEGYSGVYSIIVSQPIQSLAFFFDAGCIIALFDKKNSNKFKTIFFWFVLLYKCLTLSTGARQERTAFIIVWIFVYFFQSREKMNFKNIILITVIGFFGVLLINAVGQVRAMDKISFDAIMESMFSSSNIIGDTLGEFGSAFTTLATTFRAVPSSVPCGHGDSYLAGLLSVIPKLPNYLGLSKASSYVTKIPGTTYFGGSYLGEAYYNFSWAGLIISFVLGIVISYIQKNISTSYYEENSIKKIMSTIAMIPLILFVRGYFTDMVQKIVWVFVFIYIVQICMFRLNKREDIKC